MFDKKQTISQITSTGTDLSERGKILVEKSIEHLELNEIAFLLREYIATGICIPIAVTKLKHQNIQISMLHRNTNSENQRELIRELVLLDKGYWDGNSIANQQLKELLGLKIDYLNLSKDLKDKFKNYEPKELIWNKHSIDHFNAYMNDTRLGVLAGYGMITRLKRAVLNGNFVNYDVNGEATKIDTMDKFERLLVGNLNCNEELRELLNNEKPLKD